MLLVSNLSVKKIRILNPLNWVSIDHPQFHDLSTFLKENNDALTSWF